MATPRIAESFCQQVREAKRQNPQMSLRGLGAMFGLHNTTIMRILAEEPKPTPAPEEMEEPAERIVEEEPEGRWQYGRDWLFNGDTQTYIVTLKCRPRPLIIGAAKMRAMKRAYSNWDGQPATINEICRRFSMPRDQFMEMKALLGWTHDQEPFTAEEMMERPVEDLASDALQQKRQNLFEEFQKQDWRETKKNAEAFLNLEQSFILPLREHVESFAPSYSPQVFNIRRPRSPFAVVTNSGELHYGKAGWIMETGEEYSREIAAARLTVAREDMLQEIADRGRPDKFIMAFGNDYLHIDNEQGTTTKGTPQDCDGTAARILREGFELAVRDMDMLLSVAPVEIAYVPGNHDRLLSYALLNMMAAWYRSESGLTVRLDNRSRYYTAYGATLLGFAHGNDALKPKDYMATMAKEAAHLWSHTRFRAFYTGHLHTEVVRELIGGTHYQMKSLSGQDRYHERNAFLSDAGMNSYVLDYERGTRAAISWLPPAAPYSPTLHL